MWTGSWAELRGAHAIVFHVCTRSRAPFLPEMPKGEHFLVDYRCTYVYIHSSADEAEKHVACPNSRFVTSKPWTRVSNLVFTTRSTTQ